MTEKAVALVKPLSQIISTEATIALPEMVSIFLSKYETDLYDRKQELSTIISELKQELKDIEDMAAASVTFGEYADLGIPKLDLITTVSEKQSVHWAEEAVSVEIKIIDTKSSRTHALTSKVVRKNLKKSYIKTYNRLIDHLADRKVELSQTVQMITDMNRKERQIKAEISKMRLQEQGLEKFINSPEMAKLIKID